MGIADANLSQRDQSVEPAIILVADPIQPVDQPQGTLCRRGIRMIRECKETIYAYRYPIRRVTGVVILFFGAAAVFVTLAYFDCINHGSGVRCRSNDLNSRIGPLIAATTSLAIGIFLLSVEDCHRGH